jgi:hypothetical protein
MSKRRNPDPMPYGSWAEAMQDYVREKSHTAPPMEPVQRFSRSDGAGRRRYAREYDIVTCGATADRVEQQQQQRAQQTADHVTRAMDKSLKKAYHCYDIVTMEPKYGVDGSTVAAMGGNQEPRGKLIQAGQQFVNYDIVTNERVAGREHIPDERGIRNVISKNRPTRVTNILNHQYIQNHDERVQQDQHAVQARIDRAVDNGRAFNPISQQYNDATREMAARHDKAAYEEHRRELVRTHTYKTSGIVKRSEGHAFDIVTNHVYNPDMVLALDRRDMTSIPQRATLRQQWEHRRDAEEAVRDADVNRALRRVAKERLQDSVSHGYDVLTNQPFVQVDQADTKTKPHLVTLAASLRDPSAMEKLTHTLTKKATAPTEAVRSEGPRTTSERVFGVVDPRLAAGSTFVGRQQLLLPTLEKVKARAPETGSAFVTTTH